MEVLPRCTAAAATGPAAASVDGILNKDTQQQQQSSSSSDVDS
jgi:hypothetical protein